jgi:hypothetical protein
MKNVKVAYCIASPFPNLLRCVFLELYVAKISQDIIAAAHRAYSTALVSRITVTRI